MSSLTQRWSQRGGRWPFYASDFRRSAVTGRVAQLGFVRRHGRVGRGRAVVFVRCLSGGQVRQRVAVRRAPVARSRRWAGVVPGLSAQSQSGWFGL